MNCIHCRGRMVKASAPFRIDRKGLRLTLDSVPAWVCQQCGEPYFAEKEAESIQDLLRTLDEKMRALKLTSA